MIGIGIRSRERPTTPAEPELSPQAQQAKQLLATATGNGASSERLAGWSSIDQVFEELRRVLEGWEPEKAATPASVPAPASPPLPAERGAIVKLVRAQMGQVLQSRPRMQERRAAMKAAKVAFDERDAAYKAIALPATLDEKTVADFLAAQKVLQQQYRHAAVALSAATAAESGAELEYKRAACRLHVIVAEAVRVLPEIAEDDAIKAAQYMFKQALPTVSDQEVARVLAAPVAGSEPNATTAEPRSPVVENVASAASGDQAQRLQELEQATLVLAKAGAAALKLAPVITAAIGAFTGTREPDSIKRPVRPTEEEVQRYLTQMETFMRQRQTARQELTRQLTARQETQKAIEDAAERLRKLTAQAADPFSLDLAVAHECAAAVLGKAEIASGGLSAWFEQPKGIDDVSYPDASRRDARGIKAMRKQLREVAVCFGKLNEAETSLKLAKNTSVTSARTNGIATCLNFQECAGWTEQTRLAQEKAARDLLAMHTKIELLKAEVEAHTIEVEESTRDLYRLVVCTKPSASAAMPCDELRALLNAAAWMVRKTRDKQEHDREGDYPLY